MILMYTIRYTFSSYIERLDLLFTAHQNQLHEIRKNVNSDIYNWLARSSFICNFLE